MWETCRATFGFPQNCCSLLCSSQSPGRFLCTTEQGPGTAEDFDPRSLVFLTSAAAMGSLPSLPSVVGFADPMYAVNWNDHSDQSLCSPVNVWRFANRSSVHERCCFRHSRHLQSRIKQSLFCLSKACHQCLHVCSHLSFCHG